MLQELQQLGLFEHLDKNALDAVARRAKRLRLPPGRHLLRRGQPLRLELFLVGGVVSVRRRGGGAERIDAASAKGRSLNALAPDAEEISSATEIDVIAVESGALDETRPQAARRPVVAWVAGWQHSLLQGPVMRWFPPRSWARALRNSELQRLAAGACVIPGGQVAERVYVVAEGSARGGAEVYVQGDFFGLESALMRTPARHAVTMAEAGAVVAFGRSAVVQLAEDYDPPTLTPPPRRLDLDQVPVARQSEALEALDAEPPLAVRCSDPLRRLTVAVELMRRGFRVV